MSQRRHKKNRRFIRDINKFRGNPDLFCEEILGIKLFEFQKLLLKSFVNMDVNKYKWILK